MGVPLHSFVQTIIIKNNLLPCDFKFLKIKLNYNHDELLLLLLLLSVPKCAQLRV